MLTIRLEEKLAAETDASFYGKLESLYRDWPCKDIVDQFDVASYHDIDDDIGQRNQSLIITDYLSCTDWA